MLFQQKIKRSQFLHLALAGLASTLMLSACDDISVDSQSAASTTKAALTVATDPTYPPFESQAQAGGLEGFDIDIVKAVGQEAGLTIRFKSIPFDGTIPALRANTIDAAISAMTITPERQKTVSFSRPYFKAGLAIAVRSDNTTTKTLSDLQGKKIAVEIGTVGAKKAKTIPGADIRTYNPTVPILQEVANGNVDAFVNDAPNILYLIKTGSVKDVKVVNHLVTQEFYGIAVPQKSPKLAAINAALGKLIENGTYAKIYQKWFGEKPPQLPEIAP